MVRCSFARICSGWVGGDGDGGGGGLLALPVGLFAHVVRPLTIRLAPPFATSFRRKLRALLFLLFFFFFLL